MYVLENVILLPLGEFPIKLSRQVFTCFCVMDKPADILREWLG